MLKHIRGIRLAAAVLCTVMLLSLFTACGDDPNKQIDNTAVQSVILNITQYTFTDYLTKVKLDAVVVPSNATNANLVWTSEDVNVAAIDEEHQITPMSNGTTKIKVSTEDGSVFAECEVTVNIVVDEVVVPVSVESVRIDTAEYKFTALKDTTKLTADVLPFGADEQGITWSSSDESVATVDENGNVTAVKKGTATITATSMDGGFTASCAVTVAPKSSESTTTPSTDTSTTSKFNRDNIPSAKVDSEHYLISDNLEYFHNYNSDCVAWLYVPGTPKMNFPVTQYTDNYYYLDGIAEGETTRTGVGVDKKYKYEGSAVLDYRSSLKSTGDITNLNTIIYGHAKGTDTFNDLEYVTRTEEWFNNKNNRYICLNTLTEETVWQVFACYYTDSSKNYYLTMDWPLSDDALSTKMATLSADEQFALISDDKLMHDFVSDMDTFVSFAANWRSRIDLNENYKGYAAILMNRDYGVTIEPGDRILTLSTCSSTEGSWRYVLHAKLIKSRPRTAR